MILSTALVIAALQHWSAGPRAAMVVDAGDGVARDCLQQSYAFGLGAGLSRAVLKNQMAVQVTLRGHWLARSPTCYDAPVPPPVNGVYIENDRVNLLALPFVTSDVRLARVFGENAATLAIGGGNAWRDGHDFLYALAAGTIPWTSRPRVSWGFDLEYHVMRVTWAEVQRTYQSGRIVAEQPLGDRHKFSHALLVGFHVQGPL